MVTFHILLSTIEDVKEFVNLMNTVEYESDIVSGRYTIDAKSLMGIFSLDLSQPMRLELHTDDVGELGAKLAKFIKQV